MTQPPAKKYLPQFPLPGGTTQGSHTLYRTSKADFEIGSKIWQQSITPMTLTTSPSDVQLQPLSRSLFLITDRRAHGLSNPRTPPEVDAQAVSTIDGN
uniref:Uncharacterized protein n=1 Tax=Physcomitrium patens TaxID=3218 RepID=A0A2K1JQP7_PHYPA|nr:hypothetical protein PHYPA_016247 [Physcomitrium patens]